MFALLAALCLFACSPYEDRWTLAYSTCAPPEPFAREPADAVEDPLSPACELLLAQDLNLDPLEHEDLRALLVEAAYQLLARDLGQVQDLHEDELLRAPLLHELRAMSERSGHFELRALLYNQLAEVVRRTTEQDRGGGLAFQPLTGTLAVDPEQAGVPLQQRSGATWATALVHEAAHALTPAHGPCPGAPESDCDEDWDGAYGYQAGVLSLSLARCDPSLEPITCEALAAYLPDIRARVLAD